jgi:hypothetical protein
MARGFFNTPGKALISRVALHRCGPARVPLFLLVSLFVFWTGEARALISVSAKFDSSFLPSLEVELSCGAEHPDNRSIILNKPGRELLLERHSGAVPAQCRVRADLPLGYSVTYRVEGGDGSTANRNGCRFRASQPGQSIECRIDISQNPVKLMVYKKWVGGSGEEQNVRVSLECESGEYSGFRYINEGSPDGWEIRNIHPDGILCNVSEKVRDNFEADIIDCQGLYVLPGKGEECTLVNTKIVKRIEMLNRYGKFIMIFLILMVGLFAMKRFS